MYLFKNIGIICAILMGVLLLIAQPGFADFTFGNITSMWLFDEE